MIIYNVTINIDHAVHEEWMKWMRETHIPDVMRTGMFTENRMLKVLGDEDSGGVTYSIQYTCKDMDDFQRYEKEFALLLRNEHNKKFSDRFVAFSTLLEIVS
jgi:hypothetical protein